MTDNPNAAAARAAIYAIADHFGLEVTDSQGEMIAGAVLLQAERAVADQRVAVKGFYDVCINDGIERALSAIRTLRIEG